MKLFSEPPSAGKDVIPAPLLLNLWYRDYAKVRLVNPVMLLTHPNVMDLSAYQSTVMKDIESVRMLLLKKYVMCITIEKKVSGQALLGGSLRC